MKFKKSTTNEAFYSKYIIDKFNDINNFPGLSDDGHSFENTNEIKSLNNIIYNANSTTNIKNI